MTNGKSAAVDQPRKEDSARSSADMQTSGDGRVIQVPTIPVALAAQELPNPLSRSSSNKGLGSAVTEASLGGAVKGMHSMSQVAVESGSKGNKDQEMELGG